jgi:sugar lactone lactonase YvrE
MNTLRLLVPALLALSLFACPPPPGACPSDGSGSVVVTFSGLPAGLEPNVTLTGATAQTVTSPQTLMVGAGRYEVSARSVTVDDPVVRTVYRPKPSTPQFCLAKGSTLTVDVVFEKVATSNRLWVGNGSGGMGTTHGFDSASLRATGTVSSAWNANVAASRSIAFDKDGNLWALGNTTVDPFVARFASASFATASAPMPDVKLELPGLGCFPAGKSLAFDKDGNLYVAVTCKREVYRFAAGSIGASGALTPALTLTGFMAPEGLAFDKDGNLWVSDSGTDEVLRFDASALASGSATPARRLKVRKSDQPADLSSFKPDALAFDKDGNLWSYDFGLNIVFSVPPSEQTGTGMRNATPTVRISIPVSAVLEGLAFDEGGGLWFPFSATRLARLSPSQLTVSTGAGSPTMPDTIVTGSSLGSAQGPAFFPAPKGTPLFHALP